MDMVFDSVNGSTILANDGKPLRSAVTDKSLHVTFWSDAIKVFKSMKFATKLMVNKVFHFALKTGL